ncbi:hypothetical protein KSS87_019085 [Heliosperma pusillum]|nr:hypothetical protein KSS87_019085 [Heliosperma pusillum]
MVEIDGKSGSSIDKESVRVAVNIRPLITPELLLGSTHCITLLPGEPQVQIGSHAFTFDYVFGNGAFPSGRIFDECVAPLIDGLFKGYNGTVLAYGQTGSGKTYTMGTNYSGDGNSSGIIPQVMHTIFSRVESMKASSEFLIRVSFIEIFKEEVFDLLDPTPPPVSKGEGMPAAKASGLARVPIQIRETVNGGITLAGVTEPEVSSQEEMAAFLTRGSIARATGSTNMNSQSSRSHAIFTISMEQKRKVRCPTSSDDDDLGDDILSAKLHLVDLAGSERAKRTGADGMRLKEGIHINKGLLALGNVISALGDEKKRKEGGHVPYRDSKLTRLLQDSLGGNCKTVMIACVSPADTNAEETLNTLKYANRARNIQNKAVINRDPVAAQLQQMRGQIEQLQAELLYYRGDSSVSFDELQILKHKISLLEASNAELQRELRERNINCEHLSRRALDAQVEKDKLIMKIEAAKNGKSWDEIESEGDQAWQLGFTLFDSQDDEVLLSKSSYFADLSSASDDKETTGDEKELEEKELEHSSLQETLDKELKELDKKLQQKEAEMKRFAGGETTVLKQHYEKKVLELEHEKKVLQKEIEDLRHKLGNISSTSDDGAQKLKEDYLHKLNVLESQVSALKKKQEAQAQILRQKQKSDEAAKRLQDEIQRIKSQKVQLQNKIKQESEQFRMWKASREKEVLQLDCENALMVCYFSLPCEVLRSHDARFRRTKMAQEIARLKEEAEMLKQNNMSPCPETMSPGARNSRIFALENMLSTSSSALVSMASQLSEAEERERVFNGKGRWNQVRSLAELKTLMNYLFNIASSSRCMVRDREIECREKDLEIKELKEKVVKLNGFVRQLEKQNVELVHQLEQAQNNAGRTYDLRQGPRASGFFKFGGNTAELLEDMDTSESDHNSDEDSGDDEWVNSMFLVKKRNARMNGRSGSNSQDNDSGGSLNMDDLTDTSATAKEKSVAATCCSCSKQSFCKTVKCECRASGGKCSASCSCSLKKCINREEGIVNEFDEADHNVAEVDDADLVAQGAALLQSALGEQTEENANRRKPLADIGNTHAKSNANPRKKWRKSVIQLVPAVPPTKPVSEDVEGTTTRPENNNIPLRLPRSMRSAGSNMNLLRDRNSEQGEECGVHKESGEPARNRTSPARRQKKSEEKENLGL